MNRRERLQAINSIMELVSQYVYCNYLLGKNMSNDEKFNKGTRVFEVDLKEVKGKTE